MAKTNIATGGVNGLVPAEVEAVADTEKRKKKAHSAAARKGIRDKAAKEAKKSPGKPSSLSTVKPVSDEKTNKPAGLSPAPTTEHPSKKDQTGSFTAGSTAGSGTDKK